MAKAYLVISPSRRQYVGVTSAWSTRMKKMWADKRVRKN